ncbi:hypothetical protein SAICODRAFT_29826 [Saitoella complicata NRRL Y-17804]|uniref:uncharacterized protein n=1 Tax=Saitoella complicata (strain BCRC 22490 / CBS 7301 / JCM 7358 / NBRC 10748 / NRRL Y-17804) TaxID=698492 RepID=UPI0008679952|nr:uncharacterized protein SAICODRAFT_29826 [Saitoella complicata NRRL Y-17804]ODQ53838.1 hypothetical protein SAICODRAFT_29826 [Saitoella complicata NRRL Y-17804]
MSRSRARSPSIASDYSDITTSPSEAQAEWDESMRQLELLCSMILLPVFGKWAGRQVAYYIWGSVARRIWPAAQLVIKSKGAFNAAGAISTATI